MVLFFRCIIASSGEGPSVHPYVHYASSKVRPSIFMSITPLPKSVHPSICPLRLFQCPSIHPYIHYASSENADSMATAMTNVEWNIPRIKMKLVRCAKPFPFPVISARQFFPSVRLSCKSWKILLALQMPYLALFPLSLRHAIHIRCVWAGGGGWRCGGV